MLSSQTVLRKSFVKTLHHLSEPTRRAYQRDLGPLQTSSDRQAITKWSDIDGRQIRGFVAWRHRQGISGRSLQRNLSAIRTFYRYLLEKGMVRNNPAEGIIAPK